MSRPRSKLSNQSRRRATDFDQRSPVTVAFLECGTFLKRFLAGFLKAPQDIEDVAQETYLRAYVAEQRETIEQPKAFLFRIAKNLALTKLTKKSRQITDYIEEAGAAVVLDTAAGSDEELEAQQCLDLYCEAVARLPEKCRLVFLYRKVHGLSHSDIGQRMGLSVSSVEKYLRQGIMACQQHLQENETAPAIRKSSSEPAEFRNRSGKSNT